MGDTAVEDSEWGREGLAEGLDLVFSRDVDVYELRHAFQDGLVRLGFGAEDSREMAPVFDEDPTTDSCRGYKNVSPGSVSQDTQDPKNDCMRSTSALTSEGALVEDGLERDVSGWPRNPLQ